jgi:hypothetical protein
MTVLLSPQAIDPAGILQFPQGLLELLVLLLSPNAEPPRKLAGLEQLIRIACKEFEDPFLDLGSRRCCHAWRVLPDERASVQNENR